jgi:cytochrome c oxidase assembly protein subunit 15
VKLKKFIYTSLLVLQAGIVVTGGAVRLTGSGLGCPTWPECTPGSYTPVPHQAQGTLHSWIEFSNRLLTFALVSASIAALIGAVRWSNERTDKKQIRLLALGQFVGIFAQGILGGITVLTKLNPIPVAGHFLLSIPLIAGALSLRQRILGRTLQVHIPSLLNSTTITLTKVLVPLTALVITLGTLVTGSGPHAGDLQAKRFGFDTRMISWLHADVVIALIMLTLALLLVHRVSDKANQDASFNKSIVIFLGISLSQGLIGYIQYFTGLPELIVGLHLLGSTLVWTSAWNIKLVGKIRYLKSESTGLVHGAK